MKIKTIIFLWNFFLFSLCFSNTNNDSLINNNQNILDDTTKILYETENKINVSDTINYNQTDNLDRNKLIIIICGVSVVLIIIGLFYAKKSLYSHLSINIM